MATRVARAVMPNILYLPRLPHLKREGTRALLDDAVRVVGVTRAVVVRVHTLAAGRARPGDNLEGAEIR